MKSWSRLRTRQRNFLSCWNSAEVFLLTAVDLFLLRLPATAGAQEDGRQSSASGGAAAREQDVPRSKQPAQGPCGPHLGQDHGQRHLLSSEAPGCTGHAVRCVCAPPSVLPGLTTALLHHPAEVKWQKSVKSCRIRTTCRAGRYINIIYIDIIFMRDGKFSHIHIVQSSEWPALLPAPHR